MSVSCGYEPLNLVAACVRARAPLWRCLCGSNGGPSRVHSYCDDPLCSGPPTTPCVYVFVRTRMRLLCWVVMCVRLSVRVRVQCQPYGAAVAQRTLHDLCVWVRICALWKSLGRHTRANACLVCLTHRSRQPPSMASTFPFLLPRRTTCAQTPLLPRTEVKGMHQG